MVGSYGIGLRPGVGSLQVPASREVRGPDDQGRAWNVPDGSSRLL